MHKLFVGGLNSITTEGNKNNKFFKKHINYFVI
jgi:hypothetical protein